MKFSNRLASEKSPYLLQHAHNPVDWFPWGKEAFQKAASEDKPLILSIGYSTCHWCHVMERESFEDEATADLMNRHFVSIKVDREERPDIDSLYMGFVTAATGSGGWPMTVFLTPDQKPFYGGTYFPPEDRYGMPGFKTLLTSIASSWQTQRGQIAQSAESSSAYLKKQAFESMKGDPKITLSADTLEDAFSYYDSTFDAVYGGFGRAPKFPRPHALTFLLRYWHRTKNPRALHLVCSTLDALLRGGIYDQLGGGFHRYSTDAQWRLPHFEKMLYDQALLIRAYTEAWQVTQNPEYEKGARETADYVLREMTDPHGGFYSAQDADSADLERAGQVCEGAFFVWTVCQIEKILKPEDAKLFILFYGLREEGNVIHDPHGEFAGKNVLYRARTLESAAKLTGMSLEEAKIRLASSEASLIAHRSKRTAPHLDDKILTDWNGLMIGALSKAARAFSEPRYLSAAKKATDFIFLRLKEKSGRLLHRFRDGDSAIMANLNDDAFMAEALMELYEASFETKWLISARDRCDQMLSLYWDDTAHGFFLTASDAESLIARPKEVYDGATPSGNSVAILSLLRLARFTGDDSYAVRAREALKVAAKTVSDAPANHTQFLTALDYELGPTYEVVVAGERGDPAAEALRLAVDRRFIPNKIVAWGDLPFEWVKGKNPVAGKPAVYVCKNFTCQLPVTDAASFKSLFE